jgi:transcriptional regulator with XRE-family HTH domain
VQRARRKELIAFGIAVRQLRQNGNWSQEELAERSELHRTYISGIERGERNLGLLNVYRIARALDIAASELIGLAERSSGRATPARR